MFIHLGGDQVIRSKDVVAILDYQSRGLSQDNQAFLSNGKEQNHITQISADLVKSVVITTDRVFLSPISSLTLKRRANVAVDFDEDDAERIENKE
ncbi:extracellular matrix regulator RemB [Alteribacter aurantiacus]|uniref:extracellular matrix regulator RemB n=1 Tax=Alteribacter aurantiacus TaxID=254410 RepID=UPI000421F025|nr:extracellular matrix/biofilm biosynthesis regulator RemA family protein [Alteribacter aurantiacus]